MRWTWAALSAGLLTSCGGITTRPGDGAGGAGSQMGFGTGGSAPAAGGSTNMGGTGMGGTGMGGTTPAAGGGLNTGGVGRDPRCPSAVPSQGHSCLPDPGVPDPFSCEYVVPTKPRYCTTVAQCSNDSQGEFYWQVTPVTPDCGTNFSACPPSYSLANGSPCSGPLVVNPVCAYDEGACRCGTCVGGVLGGTNASFEWQCTTWGGNCASPRPLLGDACSTPDETCGVCGNSAREGLACTAGYWEPAPPTPCVFEAPPPCQSAAPHAQ